MSQAVPLKSMKPKHDHIIDWLITHPGARTLTPLCAELNIGRGWLSVVMKSDCFVEEYTKRRQAHSTELSKQMIEKQLKVTLKALDKVDQLLDDDDAIDLRSALEVADKTSKQLGFHPSPGFQPVLTEETIREVRTVDRDTLHEARETIRRVTHVAVATD